MPLSCYSINAPPAPPQEKSRNINPNPVERDDPLALGVVAQHVDDLGGDQAAGAGRGGGAVVRGGAALLEPGQPGVDGAALLGGEGAGVAFELRHAGAHHHVRRRRHRHLLQQAVDHLRRHRVGRVGQQNDADPLAGRERHPARAEAGGHHDSDRHVAAAHERARRVAVEWRVNLRGLVAPARSHVQRGLGGKRGD